MNDNRASLALEILKRSALLVLYEVYQHEAQPYLELKRLRERMNLPHVGVANDLVRGILNYLQDDGYVQYLFDNRWQITREGIRSVEDNGHQSNLKGEMSC
ncbi:hypothetical protein F4X10_06480 [Candidatus Poribacteria bacterium]|nr:hypothetical protein [Candidatus Poribacteria bacterium]